MGRNKLLLNTYRITKNAAARGGSLVGQYPLILIFELGGGKVAEKSAAAADIAASDVDVAGTVKYIFFFFFFFFMCAILVFGGGWLRVR